MKLQNKEKLWGKFQDHLYQELKFSRKPSSVGSNRSRFFKLLRQFGDRDFNKENFIQVMQELEATGLKTPSLNNYIKTGKLLDKFLETNHLVGFKFYHEPKNYDFEVLTPREIIRLSRIRVKYGKKRSFLTKRNKALILFLATTAGRADEVLSLTYDDLVSDPPLAIFRDTKSHEDRKVPISKSLFDLIMSLPKKSEFVFSSIRGNKLGQKEVNDDIKARARLCGIDKNVTMKTFRQSYVSSMLDEDVDWFKLSRVVGHKNPSTTLAYAQNSTKKLQETAFQHPLLRGQIPFEDRVQKLQEYAGKLFPNIKHKIIIQKDEESFFLKVTR